MYLVAKVFHLEKLQVSVPHQDPRHQMVDDVQISLDPKVFHLEKLQVSGIKLITQSLV